MNLSKFRVGPRTVAYVLAMMYGLGALIWPPVQGARTGATLAVVALTILYVAGLMRAEDRGRY